MRGIITLFLLNLSLPLYATTLDQTDTLPAGIVNVCQNAAGQKIWSNQPCPEGYKTDTHHVRPNVLPSDGLRDWAKRSPAKPNYADIQKERDLKEAVRQAQQQERQQRCENARRDYSFERTWKSKRARPGQKNAVVLKECGYF